MVYRAEFLVGGPGSSGENRACFLFGLEFLNISFILWA